MSLKYGLLGFLSYGSMSGYDLAKAFSSSVQFFWNAQNSQIYQTLAKLQKEGLVEYEQVLQTAKPNKKVYSITPKGKEAFLLWLARENPRISDEFKSAFLMKVFFAGNRTVKENIHMFQEFIEDCRKTLDSMQPIPDSIAYYSQMVGPSDPIYWKMAAAFGTSYLQMCISWAAQCIDMLEEYESSDHQRLSQGQNKQ